MSVSPADIDKLYEKTAVKFINALKLRRFLFKHDLRAQFRLYTDNRMSLQLNPLTAENHHEKISEITKVLSPIKFNKFVTSCGFLKYEGMKDGVLVIVHTSACFYGGKPVKVDTKPRTQAYCNSTGGAEK